MSERVYVLDASALLDGEAFFDAMDAELAELERQQPV
jgi:hypothetical protein